jgi:hypothetical protein
VEWLNSVLRECKVLGVIAAVTAVVWTVGYASQMDQQARWLNRLPAAEDEHEYQAALETARLDENLASE